MPRTSVKSSLPMFLKYSLLSQTQYGPPIPLQTTFPTSMTLWLQFTIHSAVGWYSTNLLCPSLNTSKTTPPTVFRIKSKLGMIFETNVATTSISCLIFAKFYPVFYTPTYRNPYFSSIMTLCSYILEQMLLPPSDSRPWSHRTQFRYCLPSPLRGRLGHAPSPDFHSFLHTLLS